LVALGYVITVRFVAESRDEDASRRFDWIGAVLVAAAVGGLAYGAIRGQQHQWHDATAFIALAVGGLATVTLPFYMRSVPHPLIPPHLFRSRNFTITNISTLLIYGALYVLFYFVALFVQGTLGYDASAAGLIGIPASVLLATGSSYFGRASAKYGPRLFMAAGPLVMAFGTLWFARIPATSTAWIFGTGAGESLLPPASYVRDLVPGYLLFGIGITMLVAPLTTALMTSVPRHNAGVASAINNAISRVGPQLAGAAIFVAIASSFYTGLAHRLPNVDTSSQQLRNDIAPLNVPPPTASPEVRAAAREASTDAFHVAMWWAAGLLFVGSAVNAVGIQNTRPGDLLSPGSSPVGTVRES
jgi:predicted MFS family arabinose efflux permease